MLALLSWDFKMACFGGSLGAANCASVAALGIWELLGLELVVQIFGLECSGTRGLQSFVGMNQPMESML